MTVLDTLGWNDHFESAYQEFLQTLPGKERERSRPVRVIGVSTNTLRVTGEDGERQVRLSGGYRYRQVTPPAIGDWCVLQSSGKGQDNLLGILPRVTSFARALGTENARQKPHAVRQQVIAANVDTVLILTTPDEDFDPERLARYLRAVEVSGARPVLVLNKIDLHDDVGFWHSQLRALGDDLDIHLISAATGQGLAELGRYFGEGQTIALIGSSGMGKSTLVNALLGHEVAQTGDIRASDSQGRHTTTSRRLYRLPGGGMLIDNPGLRDIAVWDTEEDFADIEELATHCRFTRCTHTTEPSCAVRAAVRNGVLSQSRLDAFQEQATREKTNWQK